MTWREAVRCVLAPAAAEQVERSLTDRWRGARIYLPMPAARLTWRDPRRGPAGAAERWADDLAREVERAGGSPADARAVLLPLAGTHVLI